MIIFLKYIIFFGLIYAVHIQAEYCEIETELCNGLQHLGCSTNNFITPHTWKNITLVDMSTKLRKFILEDLNEYRNQIATGKITGFPKAANIPVLTWKYEFEELMEIAVSKIDHGVFKCVATEEFPYPYEMSFCNAGNLTEIEFLGHALKKFKKLDAPKGDDKTWSALFMADNYKIGCAYVQYNEHGNQMNTVKCLVNRYAAKTLAEAYEEGDPCSNCPDDGKCSDLYPGLCMREPMGPSGPVGPPGPPGPPGMSCEAICERKNK